MKIWLGLFACKNCCYDLCLLTSKKSREMLAGVMMGAAWQWLLGCTQRS